MNTRIKHLRKDVLHLTQDSFGSRIGIKKASLSAIENGVNSPSDQTIRSICREFGVSESWLRTGEGDMFRQQDFQEKLTRYTNDLINAGEDSDMVALFNLVADLTPEERRVVMGIMQKAYEIYQKTGDVSPAAFADAFSGSGAQKKSPAAGPDIDQEVEAYRAELEAQNDPVDGSSPFATGSENIV